MGRCGTEKEVGRGVGRCGGLKERREGWCVCGGGQVRGSPFRAEFFEFPEWGVDEVAR